MRGYQELNPLRDNLIAISGFNVINNITQKEIGREGGYTLPVINVALSCLNLTDSYSATTEFTTGTLQLKYYAASDHWTLNMHQQDSSSTTLAMYFQEGKRYVASIKEVGTTYGMRTFTMDEFGINEESFEKTLATYPYQIEKVGNDMYIRWYASTADFGTASKIKYQAPAYTGGTGTSFARDVSEITHRGGISKY